MSSQVPLPPGWNRALAWWKSMASARRWRTLLSLQAADRKMHAFDLLSSEKRFWVAIK
jgi:hypothetical protein